jgi:DNA-binding transcriptional LysR family regulator
MLRDNVNDLIAFLTVARERSFTKAAAQLGVSQSALSHTVRGLEERLGVQLLTRTTRSVAPTQAGERLLRTAGPRLEEIEAKLEGLSEFRENPAGTIRITAGVHVTESRQGSMSPIRSCGQSSGLFLPATPTSRWRSPLTRP